MEEARQARLLLHVVDASNPVAEEQIKAVKAVLREIGCGDKPTLLVFNKTDNVTDRSYLDILMKQHPRAVAVSGLTGHGLDELREAVMSTLSADFADAVIETDAGNGRVLAYLAAHAEVHRQTYTANRVSVHCHLPRHLLHHIQGPGVEVRFVGEDNGQAADVNQQES